MKLTKLARSERFYYGVVILMGVLMVLWHKLVPAIDAIGILFISAITSDIAQIYSKSIVAKLEIKEKFTMKNILDIIAHDRHVYIFVFLVSPFFLLAHFMIISLDAAYVAATTVAILIFLGAGFYYGQLVHAPFAKRLLYALESSFIGLVIILIRIFIDNG